jgi:hypothetical protein
LNVFNCKLTTRLIGFSDRPGQAASPQSKRIHLKLKLAQRLVIEMNLDLRELELRAERFIGGAIEPNIFRHNSLVPSQSQSGELKIHSAFAQFLQQRLFYESREADLININQKAQERQNEEPNRDSGVTKTDPASAPKTSSFRRCRHGAPY